MTQPLPATHESDVTLHYYPSQSDRWDGLDPYWALAQLLIGECEGYHEVDTTIDGADATVSLAYSPSGIAPRPVDEVEERLYEFEVHVELGGQRKVHYNASPRFDGMQHYESGESISTPFQHCEAAAGLAVQCQGSNVDLDELPAIFARALFAIADDVGYSLHHRYFERLQGGYIAEVERYVRLTRDWNRKLIQTGGLFDRLAMLLSDERGTKGEHTWDNTEAMGYHHQVRLDGTGAAELLPGHKHGKQLKSYLPQHPDRFDEDDALYHPKFGALFRKSLHEGGAVPWADRHDLIDELDEALLNCLAWEEIPVDVGDGVESGGGNTVFVPDDHFAVVAREESVPIVDDPTPRLEAKQEHLIMTVLRDMTPAHAEITEHLATDGGQQHVEEVADATGYSLSTVYRALQALDGVLESEDGYVRFVSQKIAAEIRGIVQSAEHAIESAADRAAKLFDIDARQAASSAFSKWLARYGAAFEPPDDLDGRGTIRIDTLMSELKSRPQPYLPDALDELVEAWLQDGRGRVDIHEMIVEVDLASGKSYTAPLSALR